MIFSLTIYDFSGSLALGRFHWVMQGFPKLFALDFACFLSNQTFAFTAHQRKSN